MRNRNRLIILLSSLIPYIIIYLTVYIIKNAFAAILLYNISILILYCFLKTEKIDKDCISIKVPFLSASLFFLCSLCGFIIIFLWELVKIENLNFTVLINSYGINGISRYLFILLFSSVNPVAEELFWRYINMNNRYLNFIRDILFSGYHILLLVLIVKPQFALFAFMILTGISVIWRYILEKKRDLATVILSHAIADLSIISTILIIK